MVSKRILLLALTATFLLGLMVGRQSLRAVAEEAFLRGAFAYCMAREPGLYTLPMLYDHAPYVRDFAPMCLDIVRGYQNRQEYLASQQGWVYPLPPRPH